jgi:hypothetical protein
LAWFPLVQERPLNGGTEHRDDHSRHGTTLLILDVSIDMPAVVLSLKARGLRPIMMPLVEDGEGDRRALAATSRRAPSGTS